MLQGYYKMYLCNTLSRHNKIRRIIHGTRYYIIMGSSTYQIIKGIVLLCERDPGVTANVVSDRKMLTVCTILYRPGLLNL